MRIPLIDEGNPARVVGWVEIDDGVAEGLDLEKGLTITPEVDTRTGTIHFFDLWRAIPAELDF